MLDKSPLLSTSDSKNSLKHKRRFAFFDVDETIYEGYNTSNFTRFLVENGHVSPTFKEKDDENWKQYEASEIDYAEISRRVIMLSAAALKGKTEEEVSVWQKQYLEKNNFIFPWVIDTIKNLKDKQFEVVLISGAVHPPIEAIAQHLGVTSYATQLEVKDGVYVGTIGNELNFNEKALLLNNILNNADAFSIAVGDSTGDIAMLKRVQKGFLYEPRSEELSNLASQHQLQIVDRTNIASAISKSIRIH